MKEIIAVKTWFNPDIPEVSYTMRNGDKYIICNDGSIFFNEYGNIKYQSEELLEVPYSTDNNKWVCEMDNVFGVYDSNMKLLQKYDSMDDFVYDLTEPYSRWNKDDFLWFEV